MRDSTDQLSDFCFRENILYQAFGRLCALNQTETLSWVDNSVVFLRNCCKITIKVCQLTSARSASGLTGNCRDQAVSQSQGPEIPNVILGRQFLPSQKMLYGPAKIQKEIIFNSFAGRCFHEAPSPSLRNHLFFPKKKRQNQQN